MIKDENYLTVQGWMITKLNLSGNKLLAYALIYGFSQGKNNYFSGSYQYIMGWLNCTEKTAITTINALVDDGLIIKEQFSENGTIYNRYRAIVPSEPVEEPKKEKAEKKPRKQRENLKDKEPANDMERVAQHYLLNYEQLHQRGKVNTPEPCITWGSIMARLKYLLSNGQTVESLNMALDRAMSDDWIVQNGYIFCTILSANVLTKLINAKPQGVGVGHGRDEYIGGLDF